MMAMYAISLALGTEVVAGTVAALVAGTGHHSQTGAAQNVGVDLVGNVPLTFGPLCGR